MKAEWIKKWESDWDGNLREDYVIYELYLDEILICIILLDGEKVRCNVRNIKDKRLDLNSPYNKFNFSMNSKRYFFSSNDFDVEMLLMLKGFALSKEEGWDIDNITFNYKELREEQ